MQLSKDMCPRLPSDNFFQTLFQLEDACNTGKLEPYYQYIQEVEHKCAALFDNQPKLTPEKYLPVYRRALQLYRIEMRDYWVPLINTILTFIRPWDKDAYAMNGSLYGTLPYEYNLGLSDAFHLRLNFVQHRRVTMQVRPPIPHISEDQVKDYTQEFLHHCPNIFEVMKTHHIVRFTANSVGSGQVHYSTVIRPRQFPVNRDGIAAIRTSYCPYLVNRAGREGMTLFESEDPDFRAHVAFTMRDINRAMQFLYTVSMITLPNSDLTIMR